RRPVSTYKSFRIQLLEGRFARASQAAPGVCGLLILVVGVPVALDRRQERGLVVRRPTGSRLAVDELGLTAGARRAQTSRQAQRARTLSRARAPRTDPSGSRSDIPPATGVT